MWFTEGPSPTPRLGRSAKIAVTPPNSQIQVLSPFADAKRAAVGCLLEYSRVRPPPTPHVIWDLPRIQLQVPPAPVCPLSSGQRRASTRQTGFQPLSDPTGLHLMGPSFLLCPVGGWEVKPHVKNLSSVWGTQRSQDRNTPSSVFCLEQEAVMVIRQHGDFIYISEQKACTFRSPDSPQGSVGDRCSLPTPRHASSHQQSVFTLCLS